MKKSNIIVMILFSISVGAIILGLLVNTTTETVTDVMDEMKVRTLITSTESVVHAAKLYYADNVITDGVSSCLKDGDFGMDYSTDPWGNSITVCSVVITDGKVTSVSYGSDKEGSYYIDSVSPDDLSFENYENILIKGTN